MTRMPVGRNGVRPLRSEEPPSGGCAGGCSTLDDLRDDFAFPGAFIGRSARFSRSTKSSISNRKDTFELNDALRHWHRSIVPPIATELRTWREGAKGHKTALES